MRVAFYEDRTATDQFSPIALLRPVFELLCGHFSVRERGLRFLPVTDWGAFLRSELVDVYREDHPESHVNDLDWLRQAPTLFINGRWITSPKSLALCDSETAGIIDGEVAYLTIEPSDVSRLLEDDVDVALKGIARDRRRVTAPGILARYPWDLIRNNGNQIAADFSSRPLGPSITSRMGPQVGLVGDHKRIHIDPMVKIDPFVVIDATKGPVSVESDCVIQAFTRLEGPCHIARGSQLFRANIREATTIGPICRIGGEVENSILHGYVNKYHEGFLGRSYVCPWVNIGALSTNSDLKNDYSTVTVPIKGTPVETDELKIGCFVGDHTKTAIGSLINAGSSIGVMCLILPDGELLPKHIPSFCRIWHGDLMEGMPLERTIDTARFVMGRRNVEMTEAQERLLQTVFSETQVERDQGIERFLSKTRE